MARVTSGPMPSPGIKTIVCLAMAAIVANHPIQINPASVSSKNDERDHRVHTVALVEREDEEGHEHPHNGREKEQVNSGFDDAFAFAAEDAVPDDGRVVIESIGFDAFNGDRGRERS